MRKVLKEIGRGCEHYGVGGWRQYHYHSRQLKICFRQTQKLRYSHAKDPDKQEQKRQQVHQAYRDYLAQASTLIEQAEATLTLLSEQGALAEVVTIEHFIKHARRQIDQIERRVLKGETIAHGHL